MTPEKCDAIASDSTAEASRFFRTTFLSHIAHDIRAPTGVLLGALHELESALGATATEQAIWLTMLRRSTRRLLTLADRLSRVAELEEHSITYSRTRIDVGNFVKQAVEAARFIQSRSSVTQSLDIDEGVFATIDARWLEPSLVDVLCNAIRFAHRNVRVSVKRAREWAGAVIAIEDDGSGIAPEAMSSLFFRFVRRPKGAGAGISLSVAHAVVVGHGGRLRVELSTLPPGRGEARGARVVVELDETATPP
jgi:K+-sensing histidine kinase KdpD